MPLYDYLFCECGSTFEMLRVMKDADCDVRCPDCGSNQIQRLISTFAAGGCGRSRSSHFR